MGNWESHNRLQSTTIAKAKIDIDGTTTSRDTDGDALVSGRALDFVSNTQDVSLRFGSCAEITSGTCTFSPRLKVNTILQAAGRGRCFIEFARLAAATLAGEGALTGF